MPRYLTRSLVPLLLLAFVGDAHADPPRPAIREARHALHSYADVEGTLRVISDLTAMLPDLYGDESREAHFLRAVAATDMLMFAADHHRDDLGGRIADALGVPPGEMMDHLDLELARLNVGPFAEGANESRWVLGVLGHGDFSPGQLRTASGERRDVLFIQAVVTASGEPDSVARLAALGDDPCRSEEGTFDDDCTVAGFVEEGRRAAGALLEAHRALARLDVLSHEEPLAAALAPLITVDGLVLQDATIRPPARLPESLGVRGVGTRGAQATVDVIVHVRHEAIGISRIPHIGVHQGELRLVETGGASLPAFDRVAFSRDGRAGVTPYHELVEPLRQLASTGQVGLTAEDEVAALTVTRVLISMARAGIESPLLLGRGLQDELRSLPVSLLMGEESQAPASLWVREGGFTVHRRGSALETIPRVRRDNALHFDFATLADRAAPSARLPASMRYMSDVPWGTVIEAAFHFRPEPRPLALELY
ncbi:MAG: hypothetical protein AB8I08_15690 [Sandaracinaceae bacterium]